MLQEKPNLDVSPIVLEAQSIVRDATTIYLHHLRLWCIGIVVHGSALKGGYIPGCSDIDFQLYLAPSAFSNSGQLPLEVCLALHRDLAQIETVPFQYIQGYALPPFARKGYIGPIPGAYHVIAGMLPVAEATEEDLRISASTALEQLDPAKTFLTEGLLDHGGGKLARQVRLLCTDVWPMLYHLLTIQHGDGLGIWRLPKQEAMELLPKKSSLAQTLFAFYQAICTYYPAETSVVQALRAIESGVEFLQFVKSWWNETTAC